MKKKKNKLKLSCILLLVSVFVCFCCLGACEKSPLTLYICTWNDHTNCLCVLATNRVNDARIPKSITTIKNRRSGKRANFNRQVWKDRWTSNDAFITNTKELLSPALWRLFIQTIANFCTLCVSFLVQLRFPVYQFSQVNVLYTHLLKERNIGRKKERRQK